jgi:hypothetical protein
MRGIELSRRFYTEVVRPWLTTTAPDLQHSAALIGYGSELLGFDDELSKDHNWGPRVHLFVGRSSFDQRARELVAEFSRAAPTHFLGEPIGWRSRPHPPAGGSEAVGAIDHGLEIHTVEATLEQLLGVRSIENLSSLQWLAFSEQRLLAFTGGSVFHDDGGLLTQARSALAYFPDDVWLYRSPVSGAALPRNKPLSAGRDRLATIWVPAWWRAGSPATSCAWPSCYPAAMRRTRSGLAVRSERCRSPMSSRLCCGRSCCPKNGKNAERLSPRPISCWPASNWRTASAARWSRSLARTSAVHLQPSTPTT